MWKSLERDIKEHRYSLSTLTCCPEFFYAEVKEAWTQGVITFPEMTLPLCQDEQANSDSNHCSCALLSSH